MLTVDLNAFDIAVDLRMLRLNQEHVGTIESIKFKDGYEANLGSRVPEKSAGTISDSPPY